MLVYRVLVYESIYIYIYIYIYTASTRGSISLFDTLENTGGTADIADACTAGAADICYSDVSAAHARKRSQHVGPPVGAAHTPGTALAVFRPPVPQHSATTRSICALLQNVPPPPPPPPPPPSHFHAYLPPE